MRNQRSHPIMLLMIYFVLSMFAFHIDPWHDWKKYATYTGISNMQLNFVMSRYDDRFQQKYIDTATYIFHTMRGSS